MDGKGKKIKNIMGEVIKESDMKTIISELLDEQTRIICRRIDEQQKLIQSNESIKQHIEKYQKDIIGLEITNQTLLSEKKQCEEKYMEQCANLQMENRNIKNDLKKINEELDRVRQETILLSAKAREKDEEICELKAQVAQVNSQYLPYQQMDKAFRLFESLDTELKKRLRYVFPQDNFYCFISAGLQWQNIEGIWGFIKRKVIEHEEQGLHELHEIFCILFEIYNKQDSNSLYKLINPKENASYDNDKHVIIGTETDGHITEVLLEGIENVRTKKILYKALVRV